MAQEIKGAVSPEVKKEKIRWIPLAILTFVFSIVGTLATAMNGAVGMNMQCSFNWGVYSRPVYVASLSIIFPMLMYPFRKRTSTTTLVSLYTTGLVVSYALGHYETFALIPTGFTRSLVLTAEPVRSLMQSWWWVPPYDAVQKMVTGGFATDWSLWMPTVVFWSAYYFVFFFLSSSMMLLFRRRWIDIERIPFPHVLATYETIKRISPSSEPKGRGKWFLIGMVIGVLFMLQLVFTYLFPWWPDILLWRAAGQNAPGCFHPPAGDTLGSSIVGWVGFSKDPLSFAMFYLAPLNVSFTVWVVTLVMLALTQIAYALGYYTGLLTVSGCCRIFGFSGTSSFAFGPPFYWSYVATLGGVIGIFIMVLWNSRSYLAETVRAVRHQTGPEIEQKEPFSYRTIYMMLAASIILVLLFLFSAGLGLASALVILVFGGFINVISQLYIMGLTGMNYIGDRGVWGGWPLILVWPTQPSAYTTDYLMSHTFFVTAQNHPSHGMLIQGMTAGQAYKMADISGFSMKHIYYLIVMGTIIAIPTAIATRVWVLNTLGTGRVPIWGACGIDTLCGNAFSWSFGGGISTMVKYGCVAAGAVITIALFLLQSRFVWWPINPIGFIVAAGSSTIWFGSWDAFFVAWVAKTLTLRIGGSKTYEQYGVPIAGGMVAGVTLGSFIAYIVGMYKFLVPF